MQLPPMCIQRLLLAMRLYSYILHPLAALRLYSVCRSICLSPNPSDSRFDLLVRSPQMFAQSGRLIAVGSYP